MLEKLDQIGNSLVASKRAVILAPDDNEAHYNMGIAVMELGRLELVMDGRTCSY